MPKLTLDQELNEIAKKEVKKLSEEEEYNKIQIGEELNIRFSGNFKMKDSALISLENVNNAEEVIPRIIINESDKNKKGREILSNKEITHIGISQLMNTSIIYIVIIFSKIQPKDEKNGKTNDLEIINGKNKIKVEEIILKEINNRNGGQNDIKTDAIISNNSRDKINEEEKIEDKGLIRNGEIDNIIEVFFFTSIKYDYQYGDISIQINKIEQSNQKKFFNFEYKKEFNYTKHNYYIYYFKLKIPKKSKFQLILYYDNYSYYNIFRK